MPGELVRIIQIAPKEAWKRPLRQLHTCLSFVIIQNKNPRVPRMRREVCPCSKEGGN